MKRLYMTIGIMIGLLLTTVVGVFAGISSGIIDIDRATEDKMIEITTKEKITQDVFIKQAVEEKVLSYSEQEKETLHIKFKELQDYCYANNGEKINDCVLVLNNLKKSSPLSKILP